MSDPSDPRNRLADLMRQGFMKPRRAPRVAKPLPPIIACDDCLNWHRKGKHTATRDERARNRAKRRQTG